jgi:hypothetical protein
VLTNIMRRTTNLSSRKLERAAESAARVAGYTHDNILMRIPPPPVKGRERETAHKARVEAEIRGIGF